MTLHFRAATPLDIPAIVPLLYSSDAQVFDYIFTQKNHTALEFLRFALEQNKGSFGIKKQIVGCIEDQIVFSGTVLQGGINFWQLMQENAEISQLFFALKQNIEGILNASLFSDFLIPPHTESLFLQNLGTALNYRGQGICTSFMTAQHKQARSQHLSYCELDVGIDNPLAEKLYRKLGYQVIEEIHLPPGLIVSGIKRMRLKL